MARARIGARVRAVVVHNRRRSGRLRRQMAGRRSHRNLHLRRILDEWLRRTATTVRSRAVHRVLGVGHLPFVQVRLLRAGTGMRGRLIVAGRRVPHDVVGVGVVHVLLVHICGGLRRRRRMRLATVHRIRVVLWLLRLCRVHVRRVGGVVRRLALNGHRLVDADRRLEAGGHRVQADRRDGPTRRRRTVMMDVPIDRVVGFVLVDGGGVVGVASDWMRRRDVALAGGRIDVAVCGGGGGVERRRGFAGNLVGEGFDLNWEWIKSQHELTRILIACIRN